MCVGFLYFCQLISLRILLHKCYVSDQNVSFLFLGVSKLESSVGQTLILYKILKVYIFLSSIATFNDTNTSFTAACLQTQICFSSRELVLQVLKQILRAFWVTDSIYFFLN